MARATRSSEGVAASCRHSVAIRDPTRGTFSTQSGGGGTWRAATDVGQPAISSAWSTMAVTASTSGTTSTNSMASVMIVTASQRRPPSCAWRAIIIGQVATTTIAAQTVAPMNGNSTHRLATIMSPMNNTARVMRVRSRDAGSIFIALCPDG